MIKLAIGGSDGRMGQRLIAMAGEDPRFEIVATYDRVDRAAGHDFDVLIDFSLPEGTIKFVGFCRERSAALVTGTTGIDSDQNAQINDASSHLAIIKAANFSLGINWLLKELPGMARALAANFDIEIVETHHTRKVDAPSGTAMALLDAITDATQRSKDELVMYGRHGTIGMKDQVQIGVHAVRSGDVVGKHEIIFGGIGESITISHEARSRDTFARGALEAAAWVVGKPPGLYTMQDVVA